MQLKANSGTAATDFLSEPRSTRTKGQSFVESKSLQHPRLKCCSYSLQRWHPKCSSEGGFKIANHSFEPRRDTKTVLAKPPSGLLLLLGGGPYGRMAAHRPVRGSFNCLNAWSHLKFVPYLQICQISAVFRYVLLLFQNFNVTWKLATAKFLVSLLVVYNVDVHYILLKLIYLY